MPNYVYTPDSERITGTAPKVQVKAVANTIQTKAERAITGIKPEVSSGIPDPKADAETLYRSVRELKSRYEQLVRTRGDRGKSAILVEEIASLFEVVVRELDKRYIQQLTEPPIITDPDTGEEVTLEDLAALAKALNAHTSNTSIHFDDAPEQYVWVRNLGEWYRGMTYDEIVEYVDGAVGALPPSGLEKVEDDLNPKLGGDMAIDGYGFTAVFPAGEDLSRGSLCYLTASGTMAKADASTSVTCRSMLGLCMESVNSGFDAKFLVKGFFTGLSGLTPGDVLYVSTTTGTWQSLIPFGDGDIIRPIGYAAGTDRIFFDPDKTWTELQSQ